MSDDLTSDPLGLAGHTLASTYKLLRPIGQGGFGVVYRALHLMLNRQVAVKVQRASPGVPASVVERFRREAEACWRLRNAGAVEVYDCRVDPETGRLFYSMELLQGRSLAVYWLLAKRLPIDEALRYVVSVARCMAVAHDHGIIHRDLKPENVFLCEDGSVRILDFGSALIVNAARLTKPGEFLGTTCYMPEEQLVRPTGELDGRADIYALGVVLYHLLSGRMVYAPDQDLRVLRGRILRENPPDIKSVAPFVGEELARVIRRSLARDREGRPATMRDFIDELQRATAFRASEGAGASAPLPALPPTLEVAPAPSLLAQCAHPDTQLPKTVEQNAPVFIVNSAGVQEGLVATICSTRKGMPENLPVTVRLVNRDLAKPRAPSIIQTAAPTVGARSKLPLVGLMLLAAVGIGLGGIVSSRLRAKRRYELKSEPEGRVKSGSTRTNQEKPRGTDRSESPAPQVAQPSAEVSRPQSESGHAMRALQQVPAIQEVTAPNRGHRRQSKPRRDDATASEPTPAVNSDLIAPGF